MLRGLNLFLTTIMGICFKLITILFSICQGCTYWWCSRSFPWALGENYSWRAITKWQWGLAWRHHRCKPPQCYPAPLWRSCFWEGHTWISMCCIFHWMPLSVKGEGTLPFLELICETLSFSLNLIFFGMLSTGCKYITCPCWPRWGKRNNRSCRRNCTCGC